jgi:hypothetical protein
VQRRKVELWRITEKNPCTECEDMSDAFSTHKFRKAGYVLLLNSAL